MSQYDTQLVLGRGSVFFDRSVGDPNVAEGEQYFGNTPSFQINRKINRIQSKRSFGGQVHEGEGFVLSEDVTCSITTDNISWENYSSWFSTYNSPDVEVSGNELIPYSEELKIKQDRYFQLGVQFQIFGGFYFEDLVVTIKNQTNELREGDDYTFDPITGRLYIMPDAPRGPNGRSIVCTYYKRRSATQTIESKTAELYGSLRYMADNAVGKNSHIFFPKVRLSPVGNIEMKSDEFQQIRFEVTALKRDPLSPLMVKYRSGTPPLAITADTTTIRADSTELNADAGRYQG